MKVTSAVMLVLVVFWLSGVAYGDKETDARVRSAFVVAWHAKHDTKTNRDELAVKLYRDAWLGGQPYATPFNMFHNESPFPDDASAESILRGDHGDASTYRLWGLTEGICVSIFSERVSAIIRALAADFQGDVTDRGKAAGVLSVWQRHLYRAWRTKGNRLVLAEPEKQKLEQIARELYPVVSKRFQELDVVRRSGHVEPLAYVLRDLKDPRAIPILLGKDGRSLKYFEELSQLQRNNKADPALVKLLSDPEPYVRGRAAHALAWSGDPSLVPHATRLLCDKSPKVRNEALNMAWTLLASQPQPELQAQVRTLLHDPDSNVRQRCVFRLAQLKDRNCATVLLGLLRDGTIDESAHGNLVRAMQNLTGSNFGYYCGSDGWQPTTPNNRAAIDKFAAWIAQQKTKGMNNSTR